MSTFMHRVEIVYEKLWIEFNRYYQNVSVFSWNDSTFVSKYRKHVILAPTNHCHSFGEIQFITSVRENTSTYQPLFIEFINLFVELKFYSRTFSILSPSAIYIFKHIFSEQLRKLNRVKHHAGPHFSVY